MILDSLYFAPRSASVTEPSEPILTAIASLLAVAEWSHLTVQVIGHADDSERIGSEDQGRVIPTRRVSEGVLESNQSPGV